MSTDKIVIYGTQTCPFCVQARLAYKDKAIFIDVDEDPQKLEEMLMLSGGKRQVPVIVEGGKIGIASRRYSTFWRDLIRVTDLS
jgi:glutaredoxin 3